MDDEYVEGLNGEEIINDVLDQLATKLRGDCNLRKSDAYTGGYEGTADLHLKLHSLDTVEVHAKVTLNAPASIPLPPDASTHESEVEAHIDIPLEPSLNLVRERSGQDIPTLGLNENGEKVVKKRHYARKQSGLAKA